jgi:von Willebrand factor type A domain
MAVGPKTPNRATRFLGQAAHFRTWLTQTPPWLASLVIHVILLGALAGVTATVHVNNRPVVIETRLDAADAQSEEFRPTLSDLPVDGSINDSISFTKAGASVGQQLGSPTFSTGTNIGGGTGSGRGTAGDMAAVDLSRRGLTLTGPGGMAMPSGVRLDAKLSVRGGTDISGGVGGVSGAIGRLTYEIARSLDDRRTLVIWLLDATASLRSQREELAKRIDRVYEELGVLGKDQQRSLLTTIVGFGEKDVPMMEQPTDDLEAIKKAIRSIKEDESGTENTFTAIANALRKWGKFRTMDRRNILVIVMTDEKGDDDRSVEDVLTLAKVQYQAKVYVAGASAPLGRGQVMLPWAGGFAPVDRGPESARIERDSLPFWSGQAGLENLSSGFGPWALSRLCRETGGIYFLMQDNSSKSYDPNTLRAYQPDYGPRKEYEERLKLSAIRRAVVEAADRTGKGPQQIPSIPLEFPGDTAGMNRVMGDGQAAMAKVEYYVKPMLKEVMAVEKERDKEQSRRWRAEYDLLLGRLLAAEVRTHTYNAMCAQMKKKPKEFENPKSNAWSLRPDSNVPNDTDAGPKLAELAEKARTVLHRVIDENAGTPWAEFARRELQTDLGFKWAETYRAPPTMAATRPATPAKTPAKAANNPPPAPAVPKKI